MGDVAQWLRLRESELKFKDPGFDPLVGQVEGQFSRPSESTLVQTCLCLTPLCVYGTPPNICEHVKDPIIPIYRKRVGLTAGGMVT